MSWPVTVDFIETFDSDQTYQPIASGKLASIIAVDREVSDLIAWFRENPGRWWFRRNVMPILNPERIDRAVHFDEPLKIFSTPDAWLKNRGAGIVVLDWRSNIPLWLSGADRLIVDDSKIGRRIEAAYQREAPQIKVMNGGYLAAA